MKMFFCAISSDARITRARDQGQQFILRGAAFRGLETARRVSAWVSAPNDCVVYAGALDSD